MNNRTRRYLLDHRHESRECAVIDAAWGDFTGRLRQGVTAENCRSCDHRVWWALDARSESEALAALPARVAAHTRAIAVS
jgi:hypothetical protein